MNVRLASLLFIAAAAVAVAWWATRADEEVERVEASLGAMVAAVEDRDREALAAWVAPDYTDRLGHDAHAAVERVMHEVEHIPDLRIELHALDVDVEEETGHATATFRPVFHGEVDEALKRRPKYDFERGRRLRLRLRRHGQRYLVVRADTTFSFGEALR
ncbi:MAG: hypothetical protein ACQEXJ_22540 [Myxococcota bacterium]